jgi:hypothetical protein
VRSPLTIAFSWLQTQADYGVQSSTDFDISIMLAQRQVANTQNCVKATKLKPMACRDY